MRGALALAAIVAMTADVQGGEHVVRSLDVHDGLGVTAIAQDPAGFLWLGTVAGLERYDGRAVEAWAREAIRARVVWIRCAADGSLYVVEGTGALWRVIGRSAVPVVDVRGHIVPGYSPEALEKFLNAKP